MSKDKNGFVLTSQLDYIRKSSIIWNVSFPFGIFLGDRIFPNILDYPGIIHYVD